ncbi:MAG: trypsin-like serine protease, partial [Actinomycetota bacterium]|nr:trypsin-like serine protease [Actinomycetota bacterium]
PRINTDPNLNQLGTKTTLVTYGFTGPNPGDYTSHIQKATFPVIENKSCTDLGWSFNADKQLCLGPTKNDDLGSCKGDSGAPVVVGDATKGYDVVGLIESGDSQCKGPQVSSKLSKYEAVIRAQLGDTGGGEGVTNGSFESGGLTGWSVTGTASAQTSGAHSGTQAARLGAATATNGESSIGQTFTVPTGSDTLSLWYSQTCPDTVYYAWAKVTLKDNTAGTTSTPLAKTCTKGEGWKQVTAPLVAGHNYTLTLVNRDDNHPDDAVSTVYDSVTVD